MTSQILAAVSAIGLLGAGVAASGETRAFQAMPAMSSFADGEGAGAGEKCLVQIRPAGDNPAGNTSANETFKDAVDGGGCLCTLYRIPGAAGDSAEASLNQSQECEGSRATQYRAAGTNPVPFVLGAFTVVATVAAVAGNSKG